MNNDRDSMLYELSQNPCKHQFFGVVQHLSFLSATACTVEHCILHHSNCPKFAQMHVHWVNNILQWYFVSSVISSSPALNLYQHQVLSHWFGSWPQVAEYWLYRSTISPFVNSQWWFPSDLTGLISLLSMELQESTSAHLLQSICALAFSSYGPALTSIHNYRKNHSFDYS